MRVYLSGQPAMRRLRVKELARDYFRFHLPVFDVEHAKDLGGLCNSNSNKNKKI